MDDFKAKIDSIKILTNDVDNKVIIHALLDSLLTDTTSQGNESTIQTKGIIDSNILTKVENEHPKMKSILDKIFKKDTPDENETDSNDKGDNDNSTTSEETSQSSEAPDTALSDSTVSDSTVSDKVVSERRNKLAEAALGRIEQNKQPDPPGQQVLGKLTTPTASVDKLKSGGGRKKIRKTNKKTRKTNKRTRKTNKRARKTNKRTRKTNKRTRKTKKRIK